MIGCNRRLSMKTLSAHALTGVRSGEQASCCVSGMARFPGARFPARDALQLCQKSFVYPLINMSD